MVTMLYIVQVHRVSKTKMIGINISKTLAIAMTQMAYVGRTVHKIPIQYSPTIPQCPIISHTILRPQAEYKKIFKIN